MMQCKDIPDLPILRYLKTVRSATHWDSPSSQGIVWETVQSAMPPGTPERLRLAKMAMLIRRGLVDGCTCGCRGDFEITEKGLAFLEQADSVAGPNPESAK